MPTVASIGTYLGGNSNQTTAAVPVPSGVTAGDVIWLWVWKENGDAVTPAPGFTLLDISGLGYTVAIPGGPGQEPSQWLYVYYKRATAADTGTYTFTWLAQTWREALALRITGAATSGNPFRLYSGQPGDTAADPAIVITTPPVSLPAVPADDLLVWIGTDWRGRVFTPPPGYTTVQSQAKGTSGAYKQQTVTGDTGDVVSTKNNTGPSTAFLGSIMPAGPPPAQTLGPAGIASTAAAGAPTVAAGPVTLSPDSVAPESQVGSPTVTAGPVSLSPLGIGTSAAVGTPSLAPGPLTLAPDGVAPTAAVGAPTITQGAAGGQTVNPAGISSATAVGQPALTVGPGPAQTVTPAGIASAAAVGAPRLRQPGDITPPRDVGRTPARDTGTTPPRMEGVTSPA